MEDHIKRELGCEEGEEPLRSIHMSLQTHVQEVVVKVWYTFLLKTERQKVTQKEEEKKKYRDRRTERKRSRRNDVKR